ncbi:MAG: hypothetical protein GXY83_12035 [Rhodopirellula sp.]|nr:hypothetical protein [Rhodopirellula sp.]
MKRPFAFSGASAVSAPPGAAKVTAGRTEGATSFYDYPILGEFVYAMGHLTATPIAGIRTVWLAPRLVLLAAVCLPWLAAGCAARPLRPTELPPECVAGPAAHRSMANLARLANYAGNSHVIDPGDILDVTVVTDFENPEDATAPVRVGDDGIANLPIIGKVPLAGLEVIDAEQAIAAAAVARGVFRDPHVMVGFRKKQANRVTVVGAVAVPGNYELPRTSSSLLAALVAAGGLSEEAGADVEIRRAGPPDAAGESAPRVAGTEGQLTAFSTSTARPFQTIKVNLVSASEGGNMAYDLNDGDVVMVLQHPTRTVHVFGLVNNPGQHTMPRDADLYLLDAVAMSGGLSSIMADQVLILRRVPGQEGMVRIASSVRKAKDDAAYNIRLAPGDLVSLEETPVSVAWDAVRSVVRFAVGGSVAVF